MTKMSWGIFGKKFVHQSSSKMSKKPRILNSFGISEIPTISNSRFSNVERKYIFTQNTIEIMGFESLGVWDSPMRYHSPFVMKSDKSPPSSELSTRSSYQGQSSIKRLRILRHSGKFIIYSDMLMHLRNGRKKSEHNKSFISLYSTWWHKKKESFLFTLLCEFGMQIGHLVWK